jgi:hypothetical protein
MPAIVFASLEWKRADMPESNAPVELAPLPRLADGAFRAFVRFPAGWRRPAAGHYPVAEELLIVEGDLGMNGVTWRAGGYAWVPARKLRLESRSDSGCLAFAWFAATPRWISGEPAEAPLPQDVTLAHWRDAPQGRLYAGPEHRTWIVERRQIARLAASGMSCETLGLGDRAWRSAATDEPGDDPTETVFARVW